jgi:hypothetical protein
VSAYTVLLLCRVRGSNYYIVFPSYGKVSDEHHDYFVNEHTCPANLIRHPCLYIGEDKINDDPHGMLEFVDVAEIPEDFDLTFGLPQRGQGIDADDEDWTKIFPCISELKKSAEVRKREADEALSQQIDIAFKRDEEEIKAVARKAIATICEKSGMELYDSVCGPMIRVKDPNRDPLTKAEAILQDLADCAGSCQHEPCICKEVWEAINLIREARK